jgi:hypothetical protein
LDAVVELFATVKGAFFVVVLAADFVGAGAAFLATGAGAAFFATGVGVALFATGFGAAFLTVGADADFDSAGLAVDEVIAFGEAVTVFGRPAVAVEAVLVAVAVVVAGFATGLATVGFSVAVLVASSAFQFR